MPDLYLQALMHGEISEKRQIKPALKKAEKNRFEIEIEKEIEAHVNSLQFEDEGTTKNLLTSPEMKRARIREELREQSKLSELSHFIEDAMDLLIGERSNYLSEENSEIIKNDFKKINESLNTIDLSVLIDQNTQPMFSLSDSTIELIFKIALTKFDQTEYSDSLSLFILLTTLIPEEPNYWYKAGILAHKCTNYELANRLYAAAISLDDLFVAPRIFSIDCYLKQEMKLEAEAAYEKVLKISEIIEIDETWNELLSDYKNVFKKT